MDDYDFITVKEACRVIGGTRPINTATYYRGAAVGRFPRPEHPSPGISRIRKSKLLASLKRQLGDEEHG